MASYSSWSFSSSAILALPFLFIISMGITNAQLNANYYSSSCPLVFTIIRPLVQIAVTLEARMGASLLRMFFHDCFPNGCDGSILLDDNSTFTGEKTALPNNNSVRGYEVIDVLKIAVELVCPGVVSCADILAIAARDSVVALGGPTWSVLLGRRDSIAANVSAASTNLPGPALSLAELILSFSNQGLSVTDLVALSGAHTISQAHCVTFRDRIYNDTDIDASFAQEAQESCPSSRGSGDSNLTPLDVQTPTLFDKDYFNNLINMKGLLHSDQQLYSGGSTDELVSTYNSNATQFRIDFASAMIRMGNIQPLTGSDGEIRTNCRTTN